MTTQQQEDELLDAFRYFNNEMSAAERIAFEGLLEDRLDLQEALADVVCIQTALTAEPAAMPQVSLTHSAERTASSGSGFSRTVAMQSGAMLSGAVAIVAAIAVLLTPLLFQIPQDRTDSEMLASVETSLRRSDLEAVGLWTILESESNSSEPDGQVFSTLSSDELAVPDWMFAAIEASTFSEEALPSEDHIDGGTL